MNMKRNKSEMISKKTVKDILNLLANPQPTFVFKKPDQPRLQKDDIRKTFKTKWRDPGHPKGQFSQPPILRGKVLNEWQIQRTNLSKRSYKPPANFKGLKIDHFSRLLPQVTDQMYPEKFRQHLFKARNDFQNKQFKDNKMAQLTKRTTSFSLNIKKTQSLMKFHIPRDTLFGFPSQNKINGINTHSSNVHLRRSQGANFFSKF